MATGDSPRERDLWHAVRRDMDHTPDSDAGPKGTVLCWCWSSLAQKFYVIGYVCVERVRVMLCYVHSNVHTTPSRPVDTMLTFDYAHMGYVYSVGRSDGGGGKRSSSIL